MSEGGTAEALAAGPPVRSSLVKSSVGLIIGKFLQTGAGFAFWVVAARATSPREVGITAAAVSAVMMCTQLALLGAGSAVIVAVGRGQDAGAALDTAFTVVTAAGVVLSVGYLALAPALGADSPQAGMNPFFWTVFVLAAVAGTVTILLDQAHVALGRGGSSTLRYALGGAVTLAAVGLVGWPSSGSSAPGPRAVVLFACWSLGALVACAVGAVQLRRLMGYRPRPSLSPGRSRRLLGVGVPNQILTLTERAPGLLLPVLLAHAVSPEAAAYWYPAWMMAWAAYSAPVLMGIVQFSEGVRAPHRLGGTTRTSLTWSLALGALIAGVLALSAQPLLRLLGAEYAAESASALRWLAAGLVAYAVLQGYNAVCRSRARFAEGISVGVVLGALLCGVTLSVAGRGVTTMAVAWVSVLTVGALVAGLRLTVLLRRADR